MYKIMILSAFTLIASVALFSCVAPNDENITQKERTLSIIKPDAVMNDHIGSIIQRFESIGLRIAAIKMIQLDKKRAENFYDIHRERPFYNDLTDFMITGPVIVMVLEGDNAIVKNRKLMGATDPEQAAKGTIRKDFASSITNNAVHGSDSVKAAKAEISFFFSENEIQKRF